MSNTVTLTFAGDADKLAAAGKKAEQATKGVGDSVTGAAADFDKASKSSTSYVDKVGKLGAAVEGASTAIDNVGGTLQALSDIQQAGAERASRLARAQLDVEQAAADMEQAQRDAKQSTLDLAQAMIDGKQAAVDGKQAVIDQKQAALDVTVAQNDLATAIKEHGKNSVEAKQAAIDLEQAQADLTQANVDAEQAAADAKQAQEDQSQALQDGKQAAIDARSAQLDLNDANREAHPSDLQKWADQLNMVTPLLTAVVGVVGLVTAAQWAWNAAQLANPMAWIIIAVVALIAVIVLIATKTTWFQDLWKKAWGGIKTAASATWDFLKKIPGWIGSAFSKIADVVSKPFRSAFNFVADAWNNTIGKLSWSVPSWVPFIGGNTISVPHLPKFHSGGVVPGVPGSEQLAVLQAGERITPATGAGALVIEIRSGGSRLDDVLVEVLSRAVRARGGNVQLVLGSGHG